MTKVRKLLFRRLILILGPLFASAACTCVYGPGGSYPVRDLTVEGIVTDSLSKAGVKEIVLSLLVEDADGKNVVDTAISAADGRYFLFMNSRGSVNSLKITVITNDVDGVNNGGEYKSASVSEVVDLPPDNDVVIDIEIEKI